MIQRYCLLIFLLIAFYRGSGQCPSGISGFPYFEDFETSNGGWVPGGTGSDWAWGSPTKPVINAAGQGSKCWVIGGLTGSSYTNSEASWLQSPCFDFTNLDNPYIEFKVFWEMEQRFDGASLQYSVDNGGSWTTVGSANDPVNCLNENWYNNSSITYLAPLSANRNGWSGNKQPTTGSCSGGSGSNGWAVAKHTIPALGGTSGVLFRFIFGAGTICNNFDGFAIDAIKISEAPPNAAAFTYTCAGDNTVDFKNTSALCPTGFAWNFGDPATGANNVSSATNPSHIFSAPGTYTVTLTVSGPDNLPSTTTSTVTVVNVQTIQLTKADCQTNTGGSLQATVTGASGPYSISWNSHPVQNTAVATNLPTGTYQVTVSGPGLCTVTKQAIVETDLSCIGIYFPSAFTPNNDGKNDGFGPAGSLAALKDYRLSVYNRWGEKIFTSTNPFEKWYGRVKGYPTDSNIFVWYASFSLAGNPVETRKGTIMLIR